VGKRIDLQLRKSKLHGFSSRDLTHQVGGRTAAKLAAGIFLFNLGDTEVVGIQKEPYHSPSSTARA
jgi:hypothetical protein